MEQLSFYMVQNHKDEWKIEGGWTKDQKRANVYLKKGAAQGIITRVTNANRNLTPPKLIEFVATQVIVHDLQERVVKTRAKKDREIIAFKQSQRTLAIENAKRQMEEAKSVMRKFRFF